MCDDGQRRRRRAGTALATSALLCYGLLPIYWKQLAGVPAGEVLAHRFVWAAVFTAAVAVASGAWVEAWGLVRRPRTLGLLAFTGALLAANGYAFVWGIQRGYLLECSLGYFILPLVNVALGSLVLGERLGRARLLAVGLAAAGVTVLIVWVGRWPVVALVLAGTFAMYSLVRKVGGIPSLPGFAVESALISLVAGPLLIAWHVLGTGAFGGSEATTRALLVGAGPVTAGPLLLIVAGVRRIPLTTLGFLQYIAPTCSFLLGVLIYHADLPRVYGQGYAVPLSVTFGLIWAGLGVFSWDSVRRR